MDNLNTVQSPKKKKIAIIIIPILVVILLGLILYLGGFEYIKNTIQGLRAVHVYNEFMKNYEETLTDDIYGGSTPQETLNMFIAALEKGDIELAGKYFALDKNLSRKEWEDGLKIAQEQGRIEEIIKVVEGTTLSAEDLGLATESRFIVLNKDGLVEHSILLTFNQYSKVWKIESM